MSESDRKPREGAAYEERDVTLGPMMWFAGCFVSTVVILIAALTLAGGNAWRTIPAFSPDSRLGPMVAEGPRLQAAPESDLRQLREKFEERLTSYGWVDRAAGIAHIPIEAAKKLHAERAGEEQIP